MAQDRDYTNDNRGLRTGVAYSGVAFASPAPPIGQSFGYNPRAELTSSARDVMSWNYQYDPIGNRRQHTADPDPGTPRLWACASLSRPRAGMLTRSTAKACHPPACGAGLGRGFPVQGFRKDVRSEPVY